MFSFPFPLSKGLQEDLMTRCMGAQAKYLFQNLEFRLSETWPVLLCFLSPFPFSKGLQEDLMTRCMGAQAKYLFQNLVLARRDLSYYVFFPLSPFQGFAGRSDDSLHGCARAQTEYLFQNLEFRLSETWLSYYVFFPLSPFPFPRVCRKIWWLVAWPRRPSISSRRTSSTTRPLTPATKPSKLAEESMSSSSGWCGRRKEPKGSPQKRTTSLPSRGIALSSWRLQYSIGHTMPFPILTTSSQQGRIQDFHLGAGGGGGAKDYVPACTLRALNRTHFRQGSRPA